MSSSIAALVVAIACRRLVASLGHRVLGTAVHPMPSMDPIHALPPATFAAAPLRVSLLSAFSLWSSALRVVFVVVLFALPCTVVLFATFVLGQHAALVPLCGHLVFSAAA